MKVKSLFKAFILCATFVASIKNSNAQVEKSSELFKTIQKMDKILFENGFNKCIISDMESYISNDLEFYHDKGGITKTKESFLSTIKKNICSNTKKKPIRKLKKNSTKVFPLYENNVLYGALQNGIHEFYIKEEGKEEYITSTAKFSHLWIKENSGWKLKRVFSYDHKTPKNNTVSHITISLPNKILDTYTGQYSGSNVNATIVRKDKELVMDSGDMKLLIFSKSETLFFAKQAPLTFEFVKDTKETVIKMIVRENGKIVEEVKKVK